jgi:hypothetical protein
VREPLIGTDKIEKMLDDLERPLAAVARLDAAHIEEPGRNRASSNSGASTISLFFSAKGIQLSRMREPWRSMPWITTITLASGPALRAL